MITIIIFNVFLSIFSAITATKPEKVFSKSYSVHLLACEYQILSKKPPNTDLTTDSIC